MRRLVRPGAPGDDLHVGVLIEDELGHRTYGAELERRLRQEPGVRLHWYPIEPGVAGRLERLRPFRTNETLRKSLRGARLVRRDRAILDVLVVHTQTCALFLPLVLGRRTAVVISTDGTPRNIDELSVGYGHRQGGALEEGVKRRIVARSLRFAAVVRAWSEWTRTSVVQDYGVPEGRVVVAGPGVDTAWWSPGAPHPTADPVRILFVGGDFPRKGGPLLLEAVLGVAGSWVLDIVTESPLEVVPPSTTVHRGLRGRSEELRHLYRDSDVLVLPTHGDTYGLVVLEAMASGLPVVASDVGALRELVDHGRTGLLVPPGDREALRAALQSLVQDRELRRSMGAAGRARALAEHDADAASARLLALLRSVRR